MRKRWGFALLATGMLALTLMAGSVLAQTDGDGIHSGAKTFAGRVAAILGLDETQVLDAFRQASEETMGKKLQMKLDRMVEQGRITQEQADEYLLWHQAKPEGVMPRSHFHEFGKHHEFGGRSFGDHFSKRLRFLQPAPEEGAGQTFFGAVPPADPLLAQ